MEKGSTLDTIRQCYYKILPHKDARAKISVVEFIVAVVYCYFGDSKIFSIEAMRRYVMASLDQSIAKSSFWERLARKRFKILLNLLLAELIKQLA